jgi:S1-C subfamily serine protease
MRKEELIKKKNVVAVILGQKVTGGINTGRNAMVVYVTKKIPLSELSEQDIVPKTIEGFESDVQESGEIRALEVDRTKKWRPAPCGVSIGHFLITAGTLGMIVKKRHTPYILSNNHVLANSNNADIGDEIWQPGKIDGGGSADTIGHLSSFIKIEFEGDESTCLIARGYAAIFNFFAARVFRRRSRQTPTVSAVNKVDCAIALPLLDEAISDEILEIGKPTGFNFSELNTGDVVKKSGRTSGVTQGTVIGTVGIAKVNYGDKIAVFEDQIFTTAIAQGGDSGSVVLNEKNEVIGLLFAGSDSLTIVNKIQNVIEALGLDRN